MTAIENKYTWVINTYKSLRYLKLAIESIRENAFYKSQPIIVFCENDRETYSWLGGQSDIEVIYEENFNSKGIGGGVNECVARVKTEYFNLIHSDMYISRHYDKPLYDLVSATEAPLVAGAWRCEPNIWGQESRLGTVMVPPDKTDGFGMYYYDFQSESFLRWADTFVKSAEYYPSFRKVEGVSYMMRTKYFINNDSRFAPSSYEDMMQSVLMQLAGYDFIITNKALVWHFGSRSSIFLGQQDKLVGRSDRQIQCERKNISTWMELWGETPSFDQYGFIKVSNAMKKRYMENKGLYLNAEGNC